jgi:hypothetical protein
MLKMKQSGGGLANNSSNAILNVSYQQHLTLKIPKFGDLFVLI